MSIRARFSLCALLLISSLTAGAQMLPYQLDTDSGAFIVSEANGKTTCRDAGVAESVRLNRAHGQRMQVFGENGIRTNAGLNIILRGTAQLDANPQAKAAFERAAAIWEAKIANPITIYVDVDFGTTRFGEAFDESTIASAGTPTYLYNVGGYPTARAALRARADNAAEVAILNLLPVATMPTDDPLLNLSQWGAGAPLLRVLEEFDPVALPDDPAPAIGFNSAFAYDFDPSNGISAGTKDFEGVVVHEIGHMLGFTSRVGSRELSATPAPSVLDFFRFRPGVTTGTFTNAKRILSTGGDQVFFAGAASLAFSTGNGLGENGDERQASHWKDDSFGGGRIGIMDPTLGSADRTELTQNDLDAFDIIGWTIIPGGAPVTPLPTAPSNFTASLLTNSSASLGWTDNASNETGYVVEQKVGANFVNLSPTLPANSTGVSVGGLNAGQTYTFRVHAVNNAGNSAPSNEASVTTSGGPTGACVPNATTVCLLNNRFRVTVDYFNPIAGQPGTFQAARLLQGVQNPDTALFGFSSAQAVEVVVRVQDTRPFAPRFDIYYGAMTDFPYTVNVTDTQTGVARSYAQTGGAIVGGVDRNTFPANMLAPDDRILSGGTGSFFDGPTIEVDPTLPRVQPVATSSVAKAMPMTISRGLLPDDTRAGKVRANGTSPCTEAEPNNSLALADTLTSGVPCTGNASVADSNTEVTVKYDNGTTDKIEDIFKIALSSPGTINATLSFSGSADLDLFLFRVSGSVVEVLSGSNGSTNTESFVSNVLPAGTYYVGVSAFSGSANYTVTATASASGPCTANATTVCLLSNRFRVTVDYFNPIAGQAGTFQAARLLQGVQNPDTALFGFSSAQAVELVVRVQDTRPFAPRFDIYYGAMTDFPYTVNVTDTVSGISRSYAKSGGAIVGGVDRTSFPAN